MGRGRVARREKRGRDGERGFVLPRLKWMDTPEKQQKSNELWQGSIAETVSATPQLELTQGPYMPLQSFPQHLIRLRVRHPKCNIHD
jgi:hypothetical protein